MKQIIAGLALCLALSNKSYAQEADSVKTIRIKQISKELKVTDSQSSQIVKIQDDYKSELKKLMASKETDTKKLEKFNQIMEDKLTKLENLLSDAQLKTLLPSTEYDQIKIRNKNKTKSIK